MFTQKGSVLSRKKGFLPGKVSSSVEKVPCLLKRICFELNKVEFFCGIVLF